MIYALTEESSRAAEERAASSLGLDIAELMRRAGEAVASEVVEAAPFGAVAVVAGRGNNGGDGWVAARALAATGRQVVVYTPVPAEELEGLAGDVARAAAQAGVGVEVVDGPMEPTALEGYAVVIDALFGIGFMPPARPPYLTWFEAMNASGATVVAADIPSGVDADSGHVEELAVRADITVTFSAPKVGLLMYPGAEYAGRVKVAEIGIPWEFLGDSGDLEIWSQDDYASLVPRPAADSHKNSRGRVLVVGGSGAFPGAAILAAMGAQRMGAGYVTLAVPDSIAPITQTSLASVVTIGLPENPTRTLASKAAEEIVDIAREYDAVVLGPGLTVAHGAVLVARHLVARLSVPVVVDADGLNALVDSVSVLRERSAATVVTPHPGEIARLLDTTVSAVQADRLSCARRLAAPRTACLLKGAHSVIAGRGRTVVNTSGGPALASAGTGDVLAGMVGALLAQGLEPLEAAALGAYVHGRAGDHAASERSAVSVIAEDVSGCVPRAVRELLD